MTLEDQIRKIPHITNLGLALVDYVRSIQPGEFSLESRSWIYRPANFVTFEVHYQRASNIALSLRGGTKEFDPYDILPLTYHRGGAYSLCRIEHPNQLEAASYYICRALEIYRRGRRRSHTTERRVKVTRA
jgi:hypothetical protein